MITRVKGTHDFLDVSLSMYVITQVAAHLQKYNFIEIATPIIEHIELFKRSLGANTDVVGKEMFLIDNKGHNPELCLRPEMTASMVRAFVENGIETTPWKVFASGPVFRYERPQKGRYRQFHQVSIEIIGAHTLAHDVQCITMLDRLFGEVLSLNTYALQINFLGTPADRASHATKLQLFLSDHYAELCDACRVRKETNTMRVFDCKDSGCIALYRNAPMITDCLSSESIAEWQYVQDQLHILGVSYSHKPTLVRGLDYYNKTVFEFVSDNLGAQNAFCGGGRYDHLVSQIGGKEDQPSIGAAIGLERLLLLLEPMVEKLSLPQKPMLSVLIPLTSMQHGLALYVAEHLRIHGFCVDVLLENDSLKNMMRKANKAGATYVLLIGEDEQKAQTITIKHMTTGAMQTIPQIECVAYLKK
jgi:histidyl-tRNA synthetase